MEKVTHCFFQRTSTTHFFKPSTTPARAGPCDTAELVAAPLPRLNSALLPAAEPSPSLLDKAGGPPALALPAGGGAKGKGKVKAEPGSVVVADAGDGAGAGAGAGVAAGAAAGGQGGPLQRLLLECIASGEVEGIIQCTSCLICRLSITIKLRF